MMQAACFGPFKPSSDCAYKNYNEAESAVYTHIYSICDIYYM